MKNIFKTTNGTKTLIDFNFQKVKINHENIINNLSSVDVTDEMLNAKEIWLKDHKVLDNLEVKGFSQVAVLSATAEMISPAGVYYLNGKCTLFISQKMADELKGDEVSLSTLAIVGHEYGHLVHASEKLYLKSYSLDILVEIFADQFSTNHFEIHFKVKVGVAMHQALTVFWDKVKVYVSDKKVIDDFQKRLRFLLI